MSSPSLDIGEYRILINKVIGRGAFGEVFSGIKIASSQNVAVKRIVIEEYEEGVAEREYENIRKLKTKEHHKNIVNIEHICRDDECIYIVMEYCQYGDLNKLFKYNYQLVERIETRVKLMIQISSVIAFLHDKQIFHRDIKPANILVTNDENSQITVKLSDFGLARILEEHETTSRMYSDVGTPHYKAPELFCPGRKLYYKNVDIFALGMTFVGMVQAQSGQKLQPEIENSCDMEDAMGMTLLDFIFFFVLQFLPHTLNSVTGSGHVKYQANPLACKFHGNLAWKIYLLLSFIFTTFYLYVSWPYTYHVQAVMYNK